MASLPPLPPPLPGEMPGGLVLPDCSAARCAWSSLSEAQGSPCGSPLSVVCPPPPIFSSFPCRMGVGPDWQQRTPVFAKEAVSGGTWGGDVGGQRALCLGSWALSQRGGTLEPPGPPAAVPGAGAPEPSSCPWRGAETGPTGSRALALEDRAPQGPGPETNCTSSSRSWTPLALPSPG